MTKKIIAPLLLAAALAVPASAEHARRRTDTGSRRPNTAQIRHPRHQRVVPHRRPGNYYRPHYQNPRTFVPSYLTYGMPYRCDVPFRVFFGFGFGNGMFFDSYYYSGRMYPFGYGPYGNRSMVQLMNMQRDYRQDERISDIENRTETLEEADRRLFEFARSGALSTPRPQPEPKEAPVSDPIGQKPRHEFLYSGKIARNQLDDAGTYLLRDYFQATGSEYLVYTEPSPTGIDNLEIRTRDQKTVFTIKPSDFTGQTGPEYVGFINSQLITNMNRDLYEGLDISFVHYSAGQNR